MAKLLLVAVLLAVAVELSYQALRNPFIDDFLPPYPVRPIGPRFPTRPVGPFLPLGPRSPGRPGILVSKRDGDTKVDVDVKTGPKGTSGTVSGTHTTSGGTTVKGHVSTGPSGTSGGVKISIQG
ncbi:hypothetical protein RRG08_053118 [Elysia crispata]|uniref:Uncharacterized protein n=1 Tax=Elysia crispata TaxID=231223 RepID=A0AAE1E1V6_9GAST|nr:hypothetical protein RRG08_053118 [Elysia crispata]